MRKQTPYLVLLFILTLTLSGFNNVEQIQDNPPTEFELLVQYLEENNNYINSELAPSLILAPEIKENLKNKKYLVLDIRSEAWFDYGHIKNAVNVKGPELLNYFKNEITPAEYDKITVVCYSGQSAAYYAGLLRLYGFDNTYSLKWGMSSRAGEFAENIWVKNSTDELVDNLETTANPMPENGSYPALTTGKTDGESILKQRIEEVFAIPYKESIVKTAAITETPADFYVMNYMAEEKYNFGHLKGAVHYTPNQSLATTTNLATLPTDKRVVVNCDTGQSAAYVVAYLNVLGYNVGNLAYGSNSYMNSTLVEKGWNGFSEKEIHEFPIVE